MIRTHSFVYTADTKSHFFLKPKYISYQRRSKHKAPNTEYNIRGRNGIRVEPTLSNIKIAKNMRTTSPSVKLMGMPLGRT